MILNNVFALIEQVAYVDDDFEFSRNLSMLSGFVRNFSKPKVLSSEDVEQCCCNAGGGVAIEATLPSQLQNYGPGIASVIANKLANTVRYDSK